MNLDLWFRGDVVLQIFLFLALVTILYGKAEPFVLFGSAHNEEQFCEIILNWDQWWFRERTIRAILVEDIMGNIPVKLS